MFKSAFHSPAKWPFKVRLTTRLLCDPVNQSTDFPLLRLDMCIYGINDDSILFRFIFTTYKS